VTSAALILRLRFHGLVGPPEIPLNVNDVLFGHILLHVSAIGGGRGEFHFGADLGGTDRGRNWEHLLASGSLFQTHPVSFDDSPSQSGLAVATLDIRRNQRTSVGALFIERHKRDEPHKALVHSGALNPS